MRGSTKAPTGYAPAMNDLEAIRRVIALYAQLVDDKRFEEWGQLFTEDAVFVAHGRRIEGRARIVESIAAMLGPIQVKHLVASPVVDLVATDRAMAWTDLTSFVRGEAGVGHQQRAADTGGGAGVGDLGDAAGAETHGGRIAPVGGLHGRRVSVMCG